MHRSFCCFPKMNTLQRILLLLALGVILLYSVFPDLMIWPGMDEGYYILQAREIVHGKLPYRDFFIHVTPGTQYLTALVIKLFGVNLPLIRLFVLLNLLFNLLIFYQLAHNKLQKPFLWLFLSFLWLTDSRYIIDQHHFWSSLLALLGTYWVYRYLEQKKRKYLVLAGIFVGFTPWFTQSSGVLAILTLLGFGLIETWGGGQTSNRAKFSYWIKTWAYTFILPLCLTNFAILCFFWHQGIFEPLYRDTIAWHLSGAYVKTTELGYFPTFPIELLQTLKPLLVHIHPQFIIPALLRIPIALQLGLIYLIPLLGIFGLGALVSKKLIQTPKPYETETLQEALLWMMGTVLIFATFSYGNSMHFTSNGNLAFLLGWMALNHWYQGLGKNKLLLVKSLSVLFILLLIAAITNASLKWTVYPTLPKLPGMATNLLYSGNQLEASYILRLSTLLNEAAKKQETVFIFCESPQLYLTGNFQNATRFTLIYPVYTPPSQMTEILSDLKKNRPLYIVDDQALKTINQDPRFGRYPQEMLRLPEIQDYLNTRYELLSSLGRYRVYGRKGT